MAIRAWPPCVLPIEYHAGMSERGRTRRTDLSGSLLGIAALALIGTAYFTVQSEFRDWVIQAVLGSVEGCHQMVLPSSMTLILVGSAFAFSLSARRRAHTQIGQAFSGGVLAVSGVALFVGAGLFLMSVLGFFCSSS